ncbi:MAG: hypothetical protein LIO46_07425 [Clostridiales bacterium]|nr:hypothetical protein [Clostridiales bacterium]
MDYGAPPKIRYADLYLSPQSGKVTLEESELEVLGVVQSVAGNREPLEEHLQTNDETLEDATVYQDENGAIYIKVRYEGRLWAFSPMMRTVIRSPFRRGKPGHIKIVHADGTTRRLRNIRGRLVFY